MGDVAARLADRVVLTSDNPRREDPAAIIREIQLGVKQGGVDTEPDRRRAIELALAGASPGDLVVIAGKGHEPYQIVGEDVLTFDDREVVREIRARGGDVRLTARDIEMMTRGRLVSGSADTVVDAVSIDTRTLERGDLFVAIRGPPPRRA